MPRFRFTALDGKGRETEDVVDAANQAEAVSLIRARNLYPTRVDLIAGGATRDRQGQRDTQREAKGLRMELHLPEFLTPRVKTKQLMILTRQMSTLLEAGLPLLKGLRILHQQEKSSVLKKALIGMSDAVENGSTFSEALAMYPKVFNHLFVSMVRAGEAGGVLDVVLGRLAEFMEKAERIKRKIRSAMVYPVVVLVVAVAILVFLLTKIIPQFAEIFRDLLGPGIPLPPITQFVIGVSNTLKYRSFLILGVVILSVVGLKLWRRTQSGRLIQDRLILRMPVFGPMLVKTAVARFTRTLGTLLTSGVPILQALNIVRETTGNQVVADAIQEVHESVKEGDSMTLPLEACGVFPSMVISMVGVGEETGALPDMLERIADNYDDEVDTAVEGLTSVIEPIMIVFLAIVVGTIVIAMFVPLIDIVGRMSQQ